MTSRATVECLKRGASLKPGMNLIGKIRLLLQLSGKARRLKVSPNVTGILGLTGRAETSIAPMGAVFLRNELWPARSLTRIDRGTAVQVTGISGLTLKVEPARPDVNIECDHDD